MQSYRFRNLTYYSLKPYLPRRLQIIFRRAIATYKRKIYRHVWPIDQNAGRPPDGWQGWPEGKQFALVLSHDVDTRRGYNNVLKLAALEEELGFRSNFNLVPERYSDVSIELVNELKQRGFGIGVHGLKHDGKLFLSRRIFSKRAKRINSYIRKWGARGFTAPSMHHNLDWLSSLDIDYSISTFDTDPFEPQPEPVGTIFPFWIANGHSERGFVEVPYTMPQDSTLFIILQEKNIEIWKTKLEWIVQHKGMVLLNSHPDYMNFEDEEPIRFGYPVSYYLELLQFIKNRYEGRFYHSLARELSEKFRPNARPICNSARAPVVNRNIEPMI